jgi:hypothetical protein
MSLSLATLHTALCFHTTYILNSPAHSIALFILVSLLYILCFFFDVPQTMYDLLLGLTMKEVGHAYDSLKISLLESLSMQRGSGKRSETHFASTTVSRKGDTRTT